MTIHGRMVLLRNFTPPQDASPKGSSSTGFWSTHKIKIIDDQDDIEELGVKPLSYSQSMIHSVFRFADPANIRKSLLDGNKDHLLNQARSELMKQEHQVESLNSCIDELQQQAYAQRLELEDAHHGFIGSRREQSRLQEELSMKEKALRETQLRNIHEMGEMKRAQELRVDEFCTKMGRKS